MAKKYQLAEYEKALKIAAEDVYQAKVMGTLCKIKLSKEDWIEMKIEEWLERIKK